ncbi:hypothetical protein M5J20_11065 [Corynebacterium sp. TA-R-1]|uniref:Uncharacterized protein n=1 Tax=Corynebacterium stercoris TaxID=2943490 RepID=A0ABT1G4Y1_9CORY|nr:hypothetical protein [Corynebacterium stercoris]MCP1388715.1 hypothetical protein [Corynebacterium stercoris]
MFMKRSAFASGQRAKFFWRFSTRGNHIKDAVEYLRAAVETKYDLTPVALADLNVSFRKTLEAAERGALRMVDDGVRDSAFGHVCSIRRTKPLELYEIAWDRIPLMIWDEVSALKDAEVFVRLYYLEEGEPWGVGLHAHLKEISGEAEKVREMQNIEIDKAKEFAVSQCDPSDSWGVEELQCRLANQLEGN